MSEEKDDDIFTSKWFRSLIFASVLSGLGSSVTTLNKDTSDRYKGADAARDFAFRDARLDALDRGLSACQSNQAAHLQHSATYTQVIIQNQKDLDRIAVRVRDLERQVDALEGKR